MGKICLKCGNELNDNAKFCSKCGSQYEDLKAEEQEEESACQEESKFCSYCGNRISMNAKFCSICGNSLILNNSNQDQMEMQKEDVLKKVKKGVGGFVNTINEMTGQEGNVEIRLKELVSGVLKKHSLAEREELFICGTKKTTPKESEMVADWPKPWLFSRVFLLFSIVFIGLLIVIMEFGNMNGIPGAMFVGALAVPFSLVVFFWETNVPRNISIFDVVSTFFVGGVLSLISTLLLYEVVGVGELDYIGAILVGIVEEIGKIIVVGHYIKKQNTKYILNGLLLGACVGAGFAVFETAGYAFNGLLSSQDISYMIDILFLRAVLSIGAHTVWTAIAAVGLVLAKGENEFDNNDYYKPQFLKFLILVIVMHAIWDMPITFGSSIHLIQILLCIIVITVVLILLSSGLRQVSLIADKARKNIRDSFPNMAYNTDENDIRGGQNDE